MQLWLGLAFLLLASNTARRFPHSPDRLATSVRFATPAPTVAVTTGRP